MTLMSIQKLSEQQLGDRIAFFRIRIEKLIQMIILTNFLCIRLVL